MKFAVVVVGLVLAGCANYRVMSEGERTMMVDAWSLQVAQDAADASCKKHGRAARFKQKMDYAYVFDCEL